MLNSSALYVCRKRPENMTDEEVALKFRLLLHFRGTGLASEKEYQELDDVSLIRAKSACRLIHLARRSWR